MHPPATQTRAGHSASPHPWPGGDIRLRELGGFRLFLAALLLVTISRIHDYFGLVEVVRPGVVLLVAALVCLVLAPQSVDFRNLMRTWPSRSMLALVGTFFASTAAGLSVGASASFIVESIMPVVVLFMLLVVSVRTVADLRFLMTTYVLSLCVLVYVVFFVAGARSFGEYTRIGETAMYDGNDLGVVFLAGLPLALLLIQAGGRFARLIGWVALLGVPASIVMTASRGGFLGLAVGGAALLFAIPRISVIRRVLVLATAAVVLAVGAPAGYWGQMSTILRPSQDYNLTEETGRIAIWTRGMGYVAEYPILGVGPDNFIRAGWMISDVARGIAGRGLRDQAPHNTFLQVWAELGTIGLLLWLAITLGGVVGCLKLRARLPRDWLVGPADRRFLYLAAGYLPVCFIGFSVSAFFTSHAYTAMFYVLTAFLCGFLLVVRAELSGARTAPVGYDPPGSVVRHGGEPSRGDLGTPETGTAPAGSRGEGKGIPLPTAFGRNRR